MTDAFLLNIYQAIGWTIITFIVSMIYKRIGYIEGQEQGVQETVLIFNHYEEEATKRVFKAMKANANADIDE